jgi:hypothetical protein
VVRSSRPWPTSRQPRRRASSAPPSRASSNSRSGRRQPPESAFAARIRTHLGADPATLPTVSDTHEVTDQPNLQLALDDWLGGPGRSFEALGVASEYKRIGGLGLGDLLAPAGGLLRAGPAVGPVEWVSLLAHRYGPPSVRFHELPMVVREDIVLPDGLLERLERHTVGFSRHRERLLAAGRHLRRGILLHGRPGTGKTLTATYLARRMDDRTVVLVTGREVGMLRRSCELARLLAPSMVVLEDVDLIAEERTEQAPGQTTLCSSC